MRNKKAYPSQEIDFSETIIQGKTIYGNQHSGMDLRDYFAAKAMQSMITAFYMEEAREDPMETLKTMKSVSKNAYWFADKMINEREKFTKN